MLYLSENLKKYRMLKNLTQEDIAEYLYVTPQSVSKWGRGECYPDIELLPALANIFETSVDLLIGMDTIRAEQTLYTIHENAAELMNKGDYQATERIYRDALLIYPNNPGMLLGLAGALALQGKSTEAIKFIEKGLPLSLNEKQKATSRAVLCFLYLKCGEVEKAITLASTLPHTRESRETIQPLIRQSIGETDIDENIRYILLGERTD